LNDSSFWMKAGRFRRVSRSRTRAPSTPRGRRLCDINARALRRRSLKNHVPRTTSKICRVTSARLPQRRRIFDSSCYRNLTHRIRQLMANKRPARRSPGRGRMVRIADQPPTARRSTPGEWPPPGKAGLHFSRRGRAGMFSVLGCRPRAGWWTWHGGPASKNAQ